MRSDAKLALDESIIKESIRINALKPEAGEQYLAEARRLCAIRNIRFGDDIRIDDECVYRTVTLVIYEGANVVAVQCGKCHIIVERIAEVVNK